MRKKDIQVFKTIFNFYNFTGTFPCVSIYQKIFLIVYYLIGLYNFVSGIINYFKIYVFTAVGLIIYSEIVFFYIVISLLCLRNAFSQKQLWDKFFMTVDKFDLLIEIENQFLEVALYKYYLSFIVTNILYVLIYLLFLTSVKTMDYQKILGGSYYFTINIQLLLTFLSLGRVFMILEKRYECFKRKIRETYLFLSIRSKFANGRQLKASYLLLTNLSNIINEMFGKQIVVVIALAFLKVLACFYYISFEDWNAMNTVGLAASAVVCLVSFKL